MPSIRDILQDAERIVFDPNGPLVLNTVAEELRARFCRNAVFADEPREGRSLVLRIGAPPGKSVPKTRHGLWMRIRSEGGGNLFFEASSPHLLYFLSTIVTEDFLSRDASEFGEGRLLEPAFPILRPSFDLFLTQWGRVQKGRNPEEIVRTTAACGFSHIEVNGLAAPEPLEEGVPGEVYPRFYTYCPALDQFATSRLNRGAYPEEAIRANRENLKALAELARKYGLSAALTCFEPRSVPDALLSRYPMLRGARVDHPLRSFKPRYNLSTAHPVVLEHYAEMVESLLSEVPSIDMLAVWSNDSGAGFEYTNSLYVGRNGGGYVIREWKGDTEIAEAAARNIVRFLRVLRDAGRRVNPRFRTILRLEPFWTEMEFLREGFEDGIEVEVSSLLTQGWRLAYTHPRYEEVREIHLTALHHRFLPEERPKIDALRDRGSNAHVFFAPGVYGNHEPLPGIPFPRLLFEKLKDLAACDVDALACLGGVTPPSLAPYDINRRVLRAFQADPAMDLESVLNAAASEWVGRHAPTLRAIWDDVDEAVRSFPVPIWIFSSWGVWFRLFVRPLVPDIEAIPEGERAYYEEHLLATAHNRARIDLRMDVGFDLLDPSHARWCVAVMDRDLFPTLDRAVVSAKALSAECDAPAATDTRDRLVALRCWYRNQRNAAAWVAGVHGFLEAENDLAREDCRRVLRDMVHDEIRNTRTLLDLWNTSGTNWIMLSAHGESTFMYADNFGELLERKIRLMEGRENDTPRVDPDFQWRVKGFYPAPDGR
ncbi:MAG: hypothetical protein QHI48_09595 [Bacteroidota bacterium]|nr:hypothetical protein [Bacteroidota bacterium]